MPIAIMSTSELEQRIAYLENLIETLRVKAKEYPSLRETCESAISDSLEAIAEAREELKVSPARDAAREASRKAAAEVADQEAKMFVDALKARAPKQR